MSFVFYDTETTGTNTSFDQILQFAAIKTDWALNEVDRFEVKCRLLPFVIPHPRALTVTGTRVGDITDPLLPSHYQMCCAIRAKLLSWSPATFLGYNSIGFDEHFLRQAFYQSLHRPYLTNTNGNSRSDALAVIRAGALLEPRALLTPKDADGRPTFKLERVAPANNFPHPNAHDAMADVEATVHLCRLVSDKAPALWSNALRFSQKASVIDFVESEPAFVITESYFGELYQFPVTKIGVDPTNKNVILLMDLRRHPEQLRALNDEELGTALTQSPRIIRRLRANAAPIMTAIDDAEDVAGAPDKAELKLRAELYQKDPDLCARVAGMFLTLHAKPKVFEFVEQQIYDGTFPSDDDNSILDTIHRSDRTDWFGLSARLEDPRLRILARRLLFLECPAHLSDATGAAMRVAMARRVLGHGFERVPWLTADQALREIETMLVEANAKNAEILVGLQKYLNERSADAKNALGLAP